MDRLIVKNFGPLRDVDIELNKINLFIGENGSGKSVLAKIITIILDFTYSDEKKILEKFKDYNIDFLTKNTIIEFFNTDNELIFTIKNKKIKINSQLKKSNDTMNKIYLNTQKVLNGTISSDISKELITDLLKKLNMYKQLNDFLTSKYIPAERNLISLFNKYVTTFITADIPLPKFLLNFSSQYVRAREEIRALDFLNVEYKFQSDQERIYYNDKDYLLLEQSSSGIQSALPLYLTVKYFAQKHRSVIIEEPEQNLFPKAQTDTIKYIIEQVSNENNLFLMTHSPYVLSTINNLIFAYKVAQMSEKTKEQVKEFIKKEQWINPDNFSAYYLKDGIARNIVSKRGLISDNEIDDISDEMGDEFDTLMEIYREFKYAK